MGNNQSSAMKVMAFAAYVVPAIIALILLVRGGWSIDQPWGVAVLSTGFFGLFALGAGKWQESPVLGTYAFSLILGVGLIWTGAVIEPGVWTYIFMGGGAGVVVLTGALAALALQFNRLLGDDGGRLDAQLMQHRKIVELLERVHEASIVSDASKRILFKDNELSLLRRRVDEMIGRGEYDAALDLCEAIETTFESAEIADAFRHRILRSRQDHHEAEIHGALDQFDGLLRMRDWARAHQEAARIRRLYPNSELLSELDQRIHAARDAHKNELHANFSQAINHDDIETAMRLLRELDRYLTREEAAQYAEQAQKVVERHRENLTTRFKMAVNDRRWTEAVEIGDVIVGDFPNTKVAEEVASMIEVLRTRASEESEALSSAPPVT